MEKQNSLDRIFDQPSLRKIEHELCKYLGAKKRDHKQPLTAAEAVFDDLTRMGSRIVGDGFISIYHEWFTPESFTRICEALTEVGGVRLRDLLREAWSIFTKDKHQITLDELRRIPIRRFNSKEQMDRFDEIGEEVVREFEQELVTGKVWSLEYAKLHRAEFEPIE